MTLVVGPAPVFYVVSTVWIVALVAVVYAHLRSYRYPRQYDGSGAAPDGADACPLHGDDPPCIPCLASEHIDGDPHA